MKPHLLIVDDEEGPRVSLRAVFSREYRVSAAESAAAADRILDGEPVDIVLLDVMMPGESGIDLLRRLQERHPELPVVMISAAGSIRTVVEAMRLGAFDYVSKPFDVDDIRLIVQRALATTTLKRRVLTLESEVAQAFPVEGIVGESTSFQEALEHVRKAAPTDATVLLNGESGTGKELAARRLHALSPRRDEPFVAVHCGALPETLMESEIFGHEKGAFTGADKMKPGRFDLVGSGTLFLDEVSEMTPATQVKLLRVIQEREFMRVGGTRVIKTNARIVAASARDLRGESAAGRFREDLYYRLGVVPITLPPLRRRQGDVTRLTRHYVNLFRQTIDAQTVAFSAEALALMEAYAWPGNVRELRNVVERMLVLHGHETIVPAACLPPEFHTPTAPAASAAAEDRGAWPPNDEGRSLQERVNAYEKAIIEAALRACDGTQTRAAQRLRTTRRILKYRMERLGIGAAE